MIVSTLPVRADPMPAGGTTVELDEQEQRGEVEDVALAIKLATLVDALVFHGLDAGEVDVVLAARGQVLALVRHVLAAATAPAPAGRGPLVPACIAALVHLVSTHPDIALPGPAPAPVSEDSRAWAALGRSAQLALHRRAAGPAALNSAQRWGEIGHAVRLARLLTALDRRLLTAAKALATVDPSTVRALSAAADSSLPQATRWVEDLSEARRR